MSLAISIVKQTIFGDQRVVIADLTFDSSYPTNGELVDLKLLGLTQINFMHVPPALGYQLEYDYAAKKIKVRTPTNAATAHTHVFTGTELGTHNHIFTGSALIGHAHTFTGSALATHTHVENTAVGYVQNAVTEATSAGTPAGTLDSVSGGTPAGTNAAITAGTPAGTNATNGAVTAAAAAEIANATNLSTLTVRVMVYGN